MQMPQIEEKGIPSAFPDELNAFLRVAFRQGALVRLLFDHNRSVDQRKRRIVHIFLRDCHVIAVRKSVVIIEAMAGGKKFFLIAAVPYSDVHSPVARIF